MRKRSNSTAGLSENVRLWLAGKKPPGFFKFKCADELEALWNRHGDSENFFWRRGMRLPMTRAQLKSCEDSWLLSWENENHADACFISLHYSDDEKLALWKARGDKRTYRWSPGMWRPKPIEHTGAGE